MFVQLLARKCLRVQQGKSLLTALSQGANLFVKRSKERAPELLHQLGFGISQSGGLLERKIKPAPCQKVLAAYRGGGSGWIGNIRL